MTNQPLDNHHNTARYFVEKRQVAWALLAGVLAWGVFGYFNMPQRKDPEIPVRETVAIARWPGVPAARIEVLLTKKVEERIAQNAKVTEIRSTTKDGVAYVFAKLDEEVDDTAKELDDIRLKLDALALPAGAQPVELVKDFGDTATLMLTVASPPADDADMALRARDIRAALHSGRVAVLWPHGRSLDEAVLRNVLGELAGWLTEERLLSDPAPLHGSGFTGFDCVSAATPQQLQAAIAHLVEERLRISEFHPDIWQPMVVHDSSDVETELARVRGPKYTYDELDHDTEQIQKTLKTLPAVGRVNRDGVIAQQVQLVYSQARWNALGIRPEQVEAAIAARSQTAPGAAVDAAGRQLTVVPQTDFRTEDDIASVMVQPANGVAPVPLSDLVDVQRGYEGPADFLNFHECRDRSGQWHRSRAITLDIQMRSGEQIGRFSNQVEKELAKIRQQLPSDLIISRTSDQPQQVRENVRLFMGSLWEAIALVVLVSWIGFWEWRSALLMALAIPITLAMTFGMMSLLHVDLQQVSIASLIIALGLLVDDPVVAGDAIKRELAAGRSPLRAAWQGPTRLGRAILFATLTNIVSYLPFLLLRGDNRRFLYTLPVVMTCALIASRLVSMTFIPLLGYYLLKPQAAPTLEESHKRGFPAFYYKFGGWAIDHRWRVLAVALVVLVTGFTFAGRLKQQFFPYERQYLSYLDIWMPEYSPVSATAQTTERAEQILKKVAADYAREHGGREEVLRSLTAWVGGGGPRYWLSSSPEMQQHNYAQVLIQVRDKEDTGFLIPLWQKALSEQIPGATLDLRRLETSAPIGIPVAIRLSGNNLPSLRAQAVKLKQILEKTGIAARIRDDWGEDGLRLNLQVDPARAAAAGLSFDQISRAAAGAVDGLPLGSMNDGDRVLPIVLRLRMQERSRAGDLSNLFVYSPNGDSKVPLSQVAHLSYALEPARISRYQQFRTITVSCFPTQGHLPSETLEAAMPQIKQLEQSLPPGIRLEIAGEFKEQMKGFGQLAVVMLVSVLAIFFALVIQFRHAVKPLVVFAAIPFGIMGALMGLLIMGAPFGFMAFLGVASLIGVIVSHIIVLFDFIEGRHEAGEPLREALLDAGIQRLRPVLITVGATVTALIPLAIHGGPLWEPLCYAQIGGLTLSTLITLILVPVVYAVFVLDLKWVKWEDGDRLESSQEQTDLELIAMS